MSVVAPSKAPEAHPKDPSSDREGGFARARHWLRVHALSIVVLAAMLLPIGLVHATGMVDFPFRHDDEGTYVAQAWAYQEDFRLSHYTYWYDHPPTGWIKLAGYFVATHALERYDHAVHAGREAMLLVHLLSAALLYVLCRRLGFARVWAALALGLFSFSPLAVAFHRWVLVDNLALPWLLAAFILALTPQRRLSAYAGSAVCFALAVLTKETFLLALPALLYQLWQNTDETNRRYAWTVFGSLLVLTGLLFPVYALLRGELLPGPDHVSLVDAVRFHLLDRHPEDPQAVIHRWRSRDDLVFLLGGAAALPALLQRRLRPYVVLVALHVLVAMRPGGYLPEPYVIVFFAPVALFVAGVLDGLWRWRPLSSAGRHGQPGAWTQAANRVPALAAAALALMLAAVVVPAWTPGIETAMNENQDRPYREAREWVRNNVDTDQRLLVENPMWVDFVRDGFPEENVIWFAKLGLDPAVEEDLPDGWREFDYVIGTGLIPTMAQILEVEQLALVMENSEPVARWEAGPGAQKEVRRVHIDDADAIEIP